jgi:hypothetical protein
MFMSAVYTNAIDLAYQIKRLNGRGIRYQIDIIFEGIDHEEVVVLTWKESMDEEES